MTKKDYADILKFAINGEIKYLEENDMQRPFADMEYLNGIRVGLQIALEKIDKSAFLWEKWEDE